jgi:serine protease Do
MLFTLAIGILIGTVAQTGAKADREQTAAPDATPLTIPKAVFIENEFTKVAKNVEPSVVNIQTDYIPKTNTQTKNATPRRRGQQQEPDDQGDDNGGLPDLFQRFFGQGGSGQGLQFGAPQDQRSSSLGSGIVVDPNGYILTNNHVVENATRIKVKFLNDETEYPGTVVGTDPQTDLAVVHVDRKGLRSAKIGNSDAIQPGDWAIAIGSPFSFESTVTAGIVSAVARDLGQDSTSFQHFIQTDAAINPGNSGGPLLNINGEVIGINTMIASRSGGYQGIGFAMPINTAVKVYNEIIKAGHVTRGSVGIKFTEANPDLLKVYGANHGVFVQEVEPGGPADKAGVKAEDIISTIGGKNINKGQDLIDTVADAEVGSSLKVGIIRDKKPMTLSILIGDRSKVFAQEFSDNGAAPDSAPESAAQMKFGMSVQSLRQADRQAMGFKGNNGVLIASTEPGSFADDIGLEKGDVIIELNRQPVNSPEDIRRIQNALKPGDSVAFHVMRQAQQRLGGSGEWTSLFLAGAVPANQ